MEYITHRTLILGIQKEKPQVVVKLSTTFYQLSYLTSNIVPNILCGLPLPNINLE